MHYVQIQEYAIIHHIQIKKCDTPYPNPNMCYAMKLTDANLLVCIIISYK